MDIEIPFLVSGDEKHAAFYAYAIATWLNLAQNSSFASSSDTKYKSINIHAFDTHLQVTIMLGKILLDSHQQLFRSCHNDNITVCSVFDTPCLQLLES